MSHCCLLGGWHGANAKCFPPTPLPAAAHSCYANSVLKGLHLLCEIMCEKGEPGSDSVGVQPSIYIHVRIVNPTEWTGMDSSINLVQ